MATPIITCGDTKSVAEKVLPYLKPEFNVLYAGFDLPATLAELPKILSGNVPKPATLHTQIGPNTFDVRPRAIVFGGGYDDAAFARIRDASIAACGGDVTALGIAFFRADRALTARLVEEGKAPAGKDPGYGDAIAKRAKDRLIEVGIGREWSEEWSGELFWF